MAGESLPRILQLAATITESVRTLQDTLLAKGLPTPSFDEHAEFSIPDEASSARDSILDASAELHDLLMDPLVLVRTHGGVKTTIALFWIGKF